MCYTLFKFSWVIDQLYMYILVENLYCKSSHYVTNQVTALPLRTSIKMVGI